MADKFDPYRESLVIETNTIWPAEFADIDDARRAEIEQALHADPESCGHLEYVRVHTGFCRQITVTSQDMDRVGNAATGR